MMTDDQLYQHEQAMLDDPYAGEPLEAEIRISGLLEDDAVALYDELSTMARRGGISSGRVCLSLKAGVPQMGKGLSLYPHSLHQ